jgi:hypothetical protein
MATTTPNFGWAVPTSTDLVKDGAVAIETLGDSIDASLVDLKGGTTGQVLKKATNTDMDFVWSADSAGMTNPMTTTGDTIYSSSGSTPARLGIGSTGQVLTVSGGLPTWATPAGGGGKVLQVVAATTSTEKNIASTSFTDTNLTLTITPTSATSKVLILISQNVYLSSGTAMYTSAGYQLVRNSTSVINYSGSYDQAIGIYAETLSGTPNATLVTYMPVSYLDSPATTSAVTYKTQLKMSSTASSRATLCQQAGSTSSIIALEIGA